MIVKIAIHIASTIEWTQLSAPTLNCWTEQDKPVVQILSISLEGDLRVIRELEIELVSARGEGLEVEGVRRLDSQVVHEDEDPTAGGDLGGEGVAEEGKEADQGHGDQWRYCHFRGGGIRV